MRCDQDDQSEAIPLFTETAEVFEQIGHNEATALALNQIDETRQSL